MEYDLLFPSSLSHIARVQAFCMSPAMLLYAEDLCKKHELYDPVGIDHLQILPSLH